ncbi:MAG: YHS domain-containing (seleno)protein [Pseudomonadota bacterium]
MRILTRAVLALMVVLSAAVHAAEPINTLEKSGFFSFKPSGIAIRGYDPVAYFTQGKPVDGDDRYTTSWEGATWRFSSQEHLDLFTGDPEKYAPQYGGYCAYGVAEGGLVKIEPEAWSILDGKLYLNYDAKIQRKWEKDIPGYIARADQKFEALLAQ